MRRVSVCMNCEGGKALAEALGPEVNRAGCMNACEKAPCLSVRQDGKAAYLFGEVTPELAPEVALFIDLYDAARDGIIKDARSLPELRFKLIGRIPV